MTQRYALGVEYDGHAFCGWQKQVNSPSVQAEVEAALSRIADHPVKTICSGRTDTGVHAKGQVIHIDTPAVRPMYGWINGANRYLPDTVSLCWMQPVAAHFHARFGALARRYRYLIWNAPMRSALYAHRATCHCVPLDAARMHAAAQCLLGTHDFSSFRAVGCQAHHPQRTMQMIRVQRVGHLIEVDLQANAFLYNMVRIIVGALIRIGEGRETPEWLATMLAARARHPYSKTAPADGLYFLGPRYPEEFALPDAWTDTLWQL